MEVPVASLCQHSGAGHPASSWRREADEAADTDRAAHNGPRRAPSRRYRSPFLQSDRRISTSASFRLCTSKASGAPSLTPSPSLAPATGGRRQARSTRTGRSSTQASAVVFPVCRRGASRVPRGPAGSGLRGRRLRPLRPGTGAVAPECRALGRSVGGRGVGSGAQTRQVETPRGLSSADTRRASRTARQRSFASVSRAGGQFETDAAGASRRSLRRRVLPPPPPNAGPEAFRT